MAKPYFKLGEILLKEGLVTEEDLAKAVEAQKKTPGGFIGEVLVKSGIVSEEDIVKALSRQLDVPCAVKDPDLLRLAPDEAIAKLIPEAFARKHRLLPLARRGNTLTVAFADPTDLVLLDNVKKMSGCQIRRVIATMKDIHEGIGRFYGEGGMLKTAIEASYAAPEEISEDARAEDQLSLDVVEKAAEAPVIQLADLLVRQAIKTRASDIHIEPRPDSFAIRFRIDGVLHEIPPPSRSMYLPLVSRLKILSKMDIAEKRLPQDGSFNAKIDNRLIDFRVSTLPTIFGEKMVLRILDRSAVPLELEALGFDPAQLETYRRIIHKPYGMVLITGPTGSGKTTTLYAALNELNTPDKNVLTIEDPVEYKMPGINQVQAKSSIGLDFARGLRAFLRQDPDIILVGETRDAETAQICIRAALTGHLVFSTLHTNDAPSSISRLVDIGVEPFLVSSSLLLVMAQRLVRKLCPQCREAYKPNPNRFPKRFVWEKETLYRAKGCEACAKTGYLGRTSIHEMMVISERLQELITQRASTALIRMEARKGGMVSLEESGYAKVLAGVTSLDEVTRVTLAEE
ncbi:MAG: Flp pilus assembly complex ATPase component TadA [Candidatus Omnitrophica bacterium]|nr:Flp pilus assembly complex ATPase component TadA [Candidatus Omnitrophota bacterium]